MDLPDDVLAEMNAAPTADEPRRRGRPPKSPTNEGVAFTGAPLDIQIVRDWWDEDGERQRAGTIVSVPSDMALQLVENGIARRPR